MRTNRYVWWTTEDWPSSLPQVIMAGWFSLMWTDLIDLIELSTSLRTVKFKYWPVLIYELHVCYHWIKKTLIQCCWNFFKYEIGELLLGGGPWSRATLNPCKIIAIIGWNCLPFQCHSDQSSFRPCIATYVRLVMLKSQSRLKHNPPDYLLISGALNLKVTGNFTMFYVDELNMLDTSNSPLCISSPLNSFKYPTRVQLAF